MRRIPLNMWAARYLAARVPSNKTLYRWVKDAKIFPRPEKIGRAYWVAETAVYIDTRDPNYYDKVAAALDESQAQ